MVCQIKPYGTKGDGQLLIWLLSSDDDLQRFVNWDAGAAVVLIKAWCKALG